MINLPAAAAVALMASGFQSAPAAQPPATGWTWTLYADENPVVFAHEIPDTAHLRAVLECESGAGVVQVTVYGDGWNPGMARVSAGGATAVAQAEAASGGATRMSISTEHPVFSAFSSDGALSVAIGDRRRTVEVPQADLPELRRFAELCAA